MPPVLITKEKLHEEAKPRDRSRRRSTEEETTLQVEIPEDIEKFTDKHKKETKK